MEFSVVIPVFNEQASLEPLHKELLEVMEELPGNYEIIYVDDASTDSSLEVLKNLAQEYKRIRIISFTRNRGQSTALYAGFKASSGEWLITLDADGQNPPQDIKRLLEFQDSYDFITGIRKDRQDNWGRKIASSLARFFRWLFLRDKTKDVGCSLRLFNRKVLDYLPFFNNFHRFFTFLVRNRGFSVKEVFVAHRARKFGTSKQRMFKRLSQGLFDLGGIFWLKKRLIDYEVKYKY